MDGSARAHGLKAGGLSEIGELFANFSRVAIVGAHELTHGFGGHPLLSEVSLQVEAGERVAVVGRNGSGKSTLLRILSGELEPDEGEVSRQLGVRVACLVQDVPRDLSGTADEHLRRSLDGRDDLADWEVEARIGQACTTLGLDPEIRVDQASAGTVRRVLLAAALAAEPDLLILDEPTNHLDLEAILALEELLTRRDAALLFITHDRAFLRSVATRIVDLEIGHLASYACDYATYLKRKESDAAAREKERAEFDKKLAQEEAWIRKGIQARRTRNMGRVRSLQAMREERRARRDTVGRVRGGMAEAERSGALVLRAEGLKIERGGRTLVDQVDLELMRGDRLGVVGPNGCGKTSLIRTLLGELEPAAGRIKLGTKLEIGRFDQLHDSLEPDQTLWWNLCRDGDHVQVGDQRRHVISYLEDFLFTPSQARGLVSKLSGGERNRLQLAKLLAKPSNLLVLDEPTNDLDAETLEHLEAVLVDYSGTLIVVSHDREFLDNVATSTLAFEGEGRLVEVVGGYSDWLAEKERRAALEAPRAKAVAAPRTSKADAGRRGERPKKLTYAQELELEALPEKLEALEAEQAEVHARLADPVVYQGDGSEVTALNERLTALTNELESAYARWEELESIAEAAGS